MTTNVCIKEFEEPPFDKKEILRYAKVKEPTPEIEALLDECIAQVKGKLSYKVVYRVYPMDNDRRTVDLGFAKTDSEFLIHGLWCCFHVAVFTATVGLYIDRLVRRYAVVSPAKALLIDAIGAERVEALCDAFCAFLKEEMAKEKRETRSRMSPGYGDIPLSLQKDIFAVLDCPKSIGVSLGESYLMTPRKSVTALVGITPMLPDEEKNS